MSSVSPAIVELVVELAIVDIEIVFEFRLLTNSAKSCDLNSVCEILLNVVTTVSHTNQHFFLDPKERAYCSLI